MFDLLAAFGSGFCLLRRKKTENGPKAAASGPQEKTLDIPPYPPYPKGLPVADPKELLAVNQDLVRDILYTNDLGQHEPILRTILWNTAALFHLLPASETHHHHGTGGLLKHSLEVASLAVSLFESRYILDVDQPPSVRREKKFKWRLLITTLGLAHDLGKLATLYQITDKDGARVWNPFTCTLYDWAKANHIDRIYLTWRKGRGKFSPLSFNALLFNLLVPKEFWDYIAQPDQSLVKVLDQTLRGEDNRITCVLNECDHTSVMNDLQHGTSGAYPAQTPPEYRVVEGIKKLLAQGVWGVNSTDSVIWYGNKIVALEWPNAYKDLIETLKSLFWLDGVPTNPCELRDLLIERGVATRFVDCNRAYDFVLISHEMYEDQTKRVFVPAIILAKHAPIFRLENYREVNLQIRVPDAGRLDYDHKVLRSKGIEAYRTEELIYYEYFDFKDQRMATPKPPSQASEQSTQPTDQQPPAQTPAKSTQQTNAKRPSKPPEQQPQRPASAILARIDQQSTQPTDQQPPAQTPAKSTQQTNAKRPSKPPEQQPQRPASAILARIDQQSTQPTDQQPPAQTPAKSTQQTNAKRPPKPPEQQPQRPSPSEDEILAELLKVIDLWKAKSRSLDELANKLELSRKTLWQIKRDQKISDHVQKLLKPKIENLLLEINGLERL